MSASVVVGQQNFTSSSSNQGGSVAANTLSGPRQAIIAEGKLIVKDSGNNRVLIFNSVPTSNNASADVVIGQSNMTGFNTLGCVANGVKSGDDGLLYVNGKLLIVDSGQNRVLIFNSIPKTNGASADVVIGQPNLTTCTANTGGIGANTLNGLTDLASDGTKLFISDLNNRVLIFNSIPTSNNVSADVVVGQPDFTTSSPGTTQSKFNSPRGLVIYNGKLLVGERGNFRVTIFNSIPTANGASADVVLGQADFTTATTSPPSTSSTVHPFFMSADSKGRLYVADRNASRYLIWNSIPSSNNVAADIVIGQPDFTTTTLNNGGVRANSVGNAKGIFATDSQIIISDHGNNRVLIFNNVINNPGMTLNNSPEERDNGIIRLKGTVTIPSDSSYTISSVQYSINGGSFAGATATDGSFNSTSEEFYFDFDPKSNQQRDSSGNLIDGYTVRVKSINTNLDETDHLFYFQPFNLNEPLDNAVTTSLYPSFDFSVIKQKNILKDNLSKYQIQVRSGGSDSTASWRTIIDDIPIDGTLDNTNTVVAENDKFKAVYTDDSSRIKVYSKVNPLAGSMQWKVVGVDKTGHTQDSGARSLKVNSRTNITNNFPLAILNISGLGNPNISTNNISAIKDTYYLGSLNPIFYGIAFVNAKVTLGLTEQDCHASLAMTGGTCTKTYSTIANPQSRYGINVPKGDLKWGKKYTTNMSVVLNQDYNELPTFTLSTSGSIAKPKATSTPRTQETKENTTLQQTPTPIPTPEPLGEQQETPKKKCFLFICF